MNRWDAGDCAHYFSEIFVGVTTITTFTLHILLPTTLDYHELSKHSYQSLPSDETPLCTIIIKTTTSTNAEELTSFQSIMLNYLNALNLIGYVVNVFFAFFSTLTFDIKGPGELSDKYQTIITPTGFIFSIWGVIFIFQGIFTVVQMLKDFRAVDLVRSHSSGVSYWYFITCIAQSAWTILFGKEMILQSTIAMLIILYSLVQFVQNQSSQTNKSAKEIWLLTFPFQIHCGWIFCASMLNINVMAISMGAEGFFQTFLALISLGFLGVQAYLYLGLALGLFPPRHSPPTHVAVLTIPSVFAWATVHSSICAFL